MFKGSILPEIKAEIKKVEQKAIAEVKGATLLVVLEMMKRTPVWTGETVRNYKAGVGSVPGGFSAPTGATPGKTSEMTMGSEPLRAVNESAALGPISSLRMDKLTNVFITNTIDGKKWDLIDNGGNPDPSKARNPGGVSKLAIQSAKNRLKNFK